MATTDRELALGVVFKGRPDASFTRTIRKIQQLLATIVPASAIAGQKNLQKNLKKTKNEFSDVGKKISQISGGMERLTAAFKVIASYGAAGILTYGLINSLKSGLDAIIEFDQSLYNLQAITSSTGDKVDAMGRRILQVAKDTKFSASEVAAGMTLLGQAGLSAAEAIEAIGPVSELATGTMSTIANSADLISTVMRAFQLEASESARIADVMASAVNKSKLTIDKLRIAFNYLGPVANKVGLTIEDTAAATMMLANSGIRASTIGTGLRQVLARLKAPTEKLREEFVAAGADLTKFEKDNVRMIEIIEELAKIVPNATRAFQLFGLRGAPAVSALTAQGVKGFKEMEQHVYRTGIAAEMAETQLQGMGFQVKNLRDRFGILAIKIGEAGILGTLKGLVIALREMVDLFIKIAGHPIGQALIVFAALTTVITGSSLAFKYAVIVMASYARAMPIAEVKALVASHGLLAEAIFTVKKSLVGLAVFLKGHPLFLMAATLSLFVAGVYAFLKYKEKEIEKLQKGRMETEKNIAALEDYREKLKKATEGTSEYGATLARLQDQFPAQEFPELAEAVDLVNKKMIDNGEALDNLILKYRELRLEKVTALMNNYGKELVNLTKQYSDAAKTYLEGLDVDLPIIPKENLNEGIQVAKKQISLLLNAMAETLRKQGWKVSDGVAEVEKYLYNVFSDLVKDDVGRQVVSTWAQQIIDALQILENEADSVRDSFERIAADLPPFFQSVFNTTDSILKKVEMLMAAKRIRTQLAAIGKEAEAAGLDAAETTALLLSTEMKAWAEFMSTFHKGQKDEAAIYEERKKIIQAFLEYTTGIWSRYIKDTEERMKAVQEKLKVTSDPDVAKQLAKDLETYSLELSKAQARIDAAKKTAEEVNQSDSIERHRKYSEKLEALELKRYQLSVQLQSAAEAREIANHNAKMKRIKSMEDAEVKAAMAAGKGDKFTQGIRSKYDKMSELARRKHQHNMEQLRWQHEDKEKEITEKAAAARLEIEKRALLGEAGTAREYQTKVLEQETRFAEEKYNVEYERYVRTRELLGLGSKEELAQKKELVEAWLALEKKRTEGMEYEVDNRQRAYRRDSKAYLELTIQSMRDSGAIEDDIMRTRAQHMAEFGKTMREQFEGSMKLLYLDYKARGSALVQLSRRTAQNMEQAYSDYFFAVFKGDFEDLEDVMKNFKDAMLRMIADIIAAEQVKKFMELMGQVAAAWGGGGTTTTSQSGSYHSGPMYSAHKGRMVGETTGGKRVNVPDWIWSFAPRLHSGLKANEFPAVLERGEEVRSKESSGFGGQNVTNISIFTPDTRTMQEWVHRHSAIFGNVMASELLRNKGLVSSVRRVARG